MRTLLSNKNGKVVIERMPTLWSHDELSPEDVPNNIDVVTLKFQEERGKATTLDVLVVVKKDESVSKVYNLPSEDLQTKSNSVNTSYLGVGYDVIKSGYINIDGLKRNNPILDLNKLNAAGLIKQREEWGSSWRQESSLSIDSVYSKMHVKSSAKIGWGIFGGNFSTEYKSETSGNQTNSYSKAIAMHFTKDEWIAGTLMSNLKNYLSDDFKNVVKTESASRIIDIYGTHMLVRCYHGGLAEISNSYYGSYFKSVEQLNTAMNLTFAKIASLDASVQRDQNVMELRNASYFYGYTRGGNIHSSFSTWDSFISAYKNWVENVKNKPSLCGIPNFEDALVPIWELAATIDVSKASGIKAEFETRLIHRQAQFTVDRLVTDVNVWQMPRNPAFDLPYPYNRAVLEGMYAALPSMNLIDANAGAGGSYIRIAYYEQDERTLIQTNGHRNAIEDLVVLRSNKTPTPLGYTKINLDLNTGAGGNFLYLAYKKVTPNSKHAISFIGGHSGGTHSGEILSNYGWSWVKYSDLNSMADLNAGAKGHFIYLTMKKVPFKW